MLQRTPGSDGHRGHTHFCLCHERDSPQPSDVEIAQDPTMVLMTREPQKNPSSERHHGRIFSEFSDEGTHSLRITQPTIQEGAVRQ